MVILTDCPLFVRLCPGLIGSLTHRRINVWHPLYHAEIPAAPIFAEHAYPAQRRCCATYFYLDSGSGSKVYSPVRDEEEL
jgi:hypothetical protein